MTTNDSHLWPAVGTSIFIFLLFTFLAFDFCRFCGSFVFFIPTTTANYLRLRRMYEHSQLDSETQFSMCLLEIISNMLSLY